ncbi:hypothetical protein M426DRAFT_317016 [Hypoxylon sp. CI-4A]|nr:hypothetical protein M426DRAFT_317016 [Hypoxylon sp. CI-4A]
MDRPEPGLIKWSPNPAYDTFLHVNLQHRVVQLYEPTGLAHPGNFEFKKSSKYDEIPPLTTYDWSPAHPGLVAIGTASGTVDLINLHSDSSSHLELPIRITRTCQSVAFNTGTLLAVGLERVRNDQCLKIFDVNRLTSLDSDVSWSSLEGSINPKISLEASISISSTKFFEDSPQVLVAGIKNQGIRIYDLRDPQGGVINYQTKCNNNLAIDYTNQNYFASSSLDKPGLVIWDRRATSRPSSSNFYLSAVDSDDLPWGAALSIDKAIDVNEASFQDRGSLIRSLRFCRERSGLLAILSRTGQLKVLDTRKEFYPPEQHPKDSPEVLEVRKSFELDMGYTKDRKDDKIVSFDWLNLDSPALTPRAIVLRANGAFDILEKPSYTSEHLYKMIPWRAPHRGLEGGGSYHSLLQFESTQRPEMMGPLNFDNAVRDKPLFGEQKESVHAIVQQALKFLVTTVDPTYDLEASNEPLPNIFTNGASTAEKLKALRKYSKEVLETPNQTNDSKNQQQQSTKDLDQYLADLSLKTDGLPSNRQLHERLLASTLDTRGFPKEAQVVLDHVMLLRSKEKYLFDYGKNKDIVSDDPWLRELWDWVFGAAEAATDMGMVVEGIDLGYLGVCNVWNGDLGLNGVARLKEGARFPDAATWERCLEEITKSKQPARDGPETKKSTHRQAALRICGWGRPTDMRDSAEVLPSGRESSWYTMATAHALFEGDSNEAVKILQKASKEYPELLFVSLALQLKSQGNSGAFEALEFDDVAASKTDPYLRAISSLIATNSWENIANQESLPLRERTFIALRYFDDAKLTQWLDKELAKAIETGDIEGIVLTGITDKLVDIFAKYIEKFNDAQTATLVLSICSPRYINDYRCHSWRKAYRAHLQRHKAFLQRTKFEVESTKKSKRDGVPTITPASRQIALRCIYCDAEYELSKTGTGHAPSAAGKSQANPLTATNINAGVSCPNCGRHLPRCVVCLEVVGIPRSDKPEASPDPQIRVAARFPTFCLKCEHVMHLDHARLWFARHVECPVPECRCRCNFRANPELNYR